MKEVAGRRHAFAAAPRQPGVADAAAPGAPARRIDARIHRRPAPVLHPAVPPLPCRQHPLFRAVGAAAGIRDVRPGCAGQGTRRGRPHRARRRGPRERSGAAKPEARAPAREDVTGELRRELAAEGVPQADIDAALERDKSCKVSIFGDQPNSTDLEQALSRACDNIKRDGGRHLAERFATTAPKLMFVFLPLMAGAAMLFYWRPRGCTPSTSCCSCTTMPSRSCCSPARRS